MSRKNLTLVPIVSEGVIASHDVADGKLIPIVILDTSDRADIVELVRIHEHLPPGDVKSRWCTLKGLKDSVALILTFTRPSDVVVVLNFDIATHGAAVDLILKSKALYLRPGKEGDRPSTTVGNKAILVEIPELGFLEHWKRIRYKSLMAQFCKRGLKRREAKLAASQLIVEFETLLDFRFRWK